MLGQPVTQRTNNAGCQTIADVGEKGGEEDNLDQPEGAHDDGPAAEAKADQRRWLSGQVFFATRLVAIFDACLGGHAKPEISQSNRDRKEAEDQDGGHRHLTGGPAVDIIELCLEIPTEDQRQDKG